MTYSGREQFTFKILRSKKFQLWRNLYKMFHVIAYFNIKIAIHFSTFVAFIWSCVANCTTTPVKLFPVFRESYSKEIKLHISPSAVAYINRMSVHWNLDFSFFFKVNTTCIVSTLNQGLHMSLLHVYTSALPNLHGLWPRHRLAQWCTAYSTQSTAGTDPWPSERESIWPHRNKTQTVPWYAHVWLHLPQ